MEFSLSIHGEYCLWACHSLHLLSLRAPSWFDANVGIVCQSFVRRLLNTFLIDHRSIQIEKCFSIWFFLNFPFLFCISGNYPMIRTIGNMIFFYLCFTIFQPMLGNRPQRFPNHFIAINEIDAQFKCASSSIICEFLYLLPFGRYIFSSDFFPSNFLIVPNFFFQFDHKPVWLTEQQLRHLYACFSQVQRHVYPFSPFSFFNKKYFSVDLSTFKHSAQSFLLHL